MSAVSTRVVSAREDLEALAPAWWELWRRSTTATPFQSPGWLLAWWRHFRPGRLFAVAAERSDRLVGLAPFYIESGPELRRLLPLGISLSDYHDVLLDPDCALEVWAALVDEALRHGDAWDRWDWEELPPGAAALALSFPGTCRVDASAQSTCPVLALGGETLENCVPKRKKRDISLALNRASRRGGIAIDEVGEDGGAAALDHLFRLHRLRWESRGEAGVLASTPVQDFHRDAAPALHRAGLLRMYKLRIGGKTAGVFYGFGWRERVYGYLMGFDPAFEFESPGTIVVAHAMERALSEGAREFHFLRGAEAYKYRWGAVDRWNRRCSVTRREAAHAVA